MKLGAFLKQYLKQSLQAFKHPKQMLPTIILTVVWIALGILQIKLKENLPMKVLNFLTYAQGGLYGGIFGAIGGILGKVVVATFVNALIVPLFMGKKPFAQMAGGWKELLQNIGFQSRSAVAPLLKGFGAALLIYILFNATARLENSMAGIMAAVSLALAMGKKSGFMWELAISYANTVSKGKKLNYQSILRALTGMTLGFALAVALTAVAPSLVSLLGIVALIVGWIMGKGTKKEAVSTILLVILTLLPVQEARAQDSGVWTLKEVKTENHGSYSVEAMNDQVTINNIQGDASKFSFDYSVKASDGELTNGKCTGSISELKGTFSPYESVIIQSKWSCKPNSFRVEESTGFMLSSNSSDDINFIYLLDVRRYDDDEHTFTFPELDKVNGENLVVSAFVTTVGLDGNPLLKTDYIFEWTQVNQKGWVEEEEGNSVFEAPEWVKQILGLDQDHANEVWTVFISLVGGLMGGGLLGGAGGAAAGGGGLFPDGPGFLSPEDERRRRFLKDNEDGTRTMEDPATGKQYTLYPTYDEDGNLTGWKNENDTPYDEAGIDEWLDWRERNSSAFSQDDATAEQNLEDWRERNEELKNMDREAYNKEKKAIEAQRKRDDYIEKVANNYYVDLAPIEKGKSTEKEKQEAKIKAVRRGINEMKKEALQKYREMAELEQGLSTLIAYTELVQRVCDSTITIGAQVVPGGKTVQTYYSLAKNGLGRGFEAHAKGGSFAKGLAAGSVEGALEVAQNNANVLGNATGSKIAEYGMQVGAGGIKEAFSGWYEGKSAQETAKGIGVSYTGDVIKIVTGELIGGSVKFINAGYQGSGYVYGSMYRENVEGAITKNLEIGKGMTESFNTGYDVIMTLFK